MKQIFIFLSVLLVASACFFEEDDKEDNVVLLEDVIYVSSDQLRILGRIYSTAGNIEDHGFYISKTEDFADAEINSLGPKEDLGLFLADIQPLSQETEFYYKAFVQSGGVITFSDFETITTFKSKINDFSPKYGREGDIITIDGINLTEDLDYYFGNNVGEVTKRISDFRVLVKVPAHEDEFRVPVVAKTDELSLDAGTFDYITGKWTQLSTFDIIRRDVLLFNEEATDEFTVGFGTNGSGSIRPDFNEIDLSFYNVTKTNILDPLLPTATRGAFFTESGYFGGGASFRFFYSDTNWEWVLSDEFWKYESDGSFTNLGNLSIDESTSVASHNSVASEINGDIYVFGGERSRRAELIEIVFDQIPVRGVFKYTDHWEQINTLPFDFLGYQPHATVNGEVWFVTTEEEIWVYNAISNEFRLLPLEYPTSVFDHGSMIEIDGILYTGLFYRHGEFWEIDVETLTVKPKNDFPGLVSYRNVASFKKNENLFFLRSPALSNNGNMELWMLEPNEFED